jgi:ubiquinone/menaquinone biosynthesis C-methylase UbiE
MRVSRRSSLWVQYILDQWVPPAIRDSRWFMAPPMRLVLRGSSREFMSFKNSVFDLSDDEFSDLYRRAGSVALLQGETDLNQPCVDAILASLVGTTVLEAGAGRGYLAGLMASSHQVTATDIVVSGDVRAKHPDVVFQEANVERLPFPDDAFDTVVCTHTLEHVQNLPVAVRELRRVAKHRLIVVVPRQRPYKYAFNLHVHFFPYAWSLRAALGHRAGAVIRNLGDWFYVEDTPTPDV